MQSSPTPSRRRLARIRAGLAVPASAALALGLSTGPARGHAMAERYELPVPLELYLLGAGAVVALSFAAMLLFERWAPRPGAYPRVTLMGEAAARVLGHRLALLPLQVVSVALFALVLVAGVIGEQAALHNLAPTLVWVVWWIGMAYASALVGNLWPLVNPWSILFAWAEAAVRRLAPGRRLSLDLAYPAGLGAWPAAGLFLAFAAAEIAWPGADVPANLAAAIGAYSALTWAGMAAFGRRTWLMRGEAFTVAFGLLARFAPTETRVLGPQACGACRALGCPAAGDCVDCPTCFARARPKARRVALRPFAAGLLAARPLSASETGFALLILSTVTYDGFVETPAWRGLVERAYLSEALAGPLAWLHAATGDVLAVLTGLGLVGAPLVFAAVFLACARLMALAAGSARPAGELARAFVLTLVPIAVAYHLAHYMAYLLLAGQYVIPLASDPFGYGWDLFGTANYFVGIAPMTAQTVWYVAVAAIVLAHVVAVVLAHGQALAVFADARAARRSQVPMLVLMVAYTMSSLWILAQPVVEPAAPG